MARVAGINLPKGKRIEIGLTYIYGIGRSLSKNILNDLKINLDTKVENLTPQEEQLIRDYVAKIPTEGDLRRQVSLNVKRLQEIGSYRGTRHRRRLPVRGQRTKTNSRTAHGNKRATAGSGKKTVEKK